MIVESPKSLTAVVHVNFHYQEPQVKPVGEGEIEILSRILNQASGLSPEMQEVLVKFADHLGNLKDRAEPR